MNPVLIVVGVCSAFLVVIVALVIVAIATAPNDLSSQGDDLRKVKQWPENSPMQPNVWLQGDPVPRPPAEQTVSSSETEKLLRALSFDPSLEIPDSDPKVNLMGKFVVDWKHDFGRLVADVLSAQEFLASALDKGEEEVGQAISSYVLRMAPLLEQIDDALTDISLSKYAFTLKLLITLPLSRTMQAKLHSLPETVLKKLNVVFVKHNHDDPQGRILRANPDVAIELMFQSLMSWSELDADSNAVPIAKLLSMLPLESQIERWLPVIRSGLCKDPETMHALLSLRGRLDPAVYEAVQTQIASKDASGTRIGDLFFPSKDPSLRLSAPNPPEKYGEKKGFQVVWSRQLQIDRNLLLTPDNNGTSDELWEDANDELKLSANHLKFLHELDSILEEYLLHLSNNDPWHSFCTMMMWIDPNVRRDRVWPNALLGSVVQRLLRRPIPCDAGQSLRSFVPSIASPGCFVPTTMVHPRTMFYLAVMQRQSCYLFGSLSLTFPKELYFTKNVDAIPELAVSDYASGAPVPLSLPMILFNGDVVGETADCPDDDNSEAHLQLVHAAYMAVAKRRWREAVLAYRHTIERITSDIDEPWWERTLAPGRPLDPAALNNSSREIFFNQPGSQLESRASLISALQTLDPAQQRHFCLFVNGTPYVGNYFQGDQRLYFILEEDITLGPGQIASSMHFLRVGPASGGDDKYRELVDKIASIDPLVSYEGLDDIVCPYESDWNAEVKKYHDDYKKGKGSAE